MGENICQEKSSRRENKDKTGGGKVNARWLLAGSPAKRR
jgi:hypothetical protein